MKFIYFAEFYLKGAVVQWHDHHTNVQEISGLISIPYSRVAL